VTVEPTRGGARAQYHLGSRELEPHGGEASTGDRWGFYLCRLYVWNRARQQADQSPARKQGDLELKGPLVYTRGSGPLVYTRGSKPCVRGCGFRSVGLWLRRAALRAAALRAAASPWGAGWQRRWAHTPGIGGPRVTRGRAGSPRGWNRRVAQCADGETHLAVVDSEELRRWLGEYPLGALFRSGELEGMGASGA
jgi:hypothetical protein